MFTGASYYDHRAYDYEAALKASMSNQGDVMAAESCQRLQRVCQTYGLKINEDIPSDGACFFHSVFDQLLRLQQPLPDGVKSALDLRKKIVESMSRNSLLKVPFQILKCV